MPFVSSRDRSAKGGRYFAKSISADQYDDYENIKANNSEKFSGSAQDALASDYKAMLKEQEEAKSFGIPDSHSELSYESDIEKERQLERRRKEWGRSL